MRHNLNLPAFLPRLIEVSRTQAAGIILLATAYIILGQLGLLLAVPPGYATVIWPPSGIALGVLLIRGPSLWPGIFIGSLSLNAGIGGAFSFDTGLAWDKLAIAVTIAGGSTIQAVTACGLIARLFGLPIALNSPRDATLLFAIAAPGACVIAATVGVGALYLGNVIPASALTHNWWTWWAGDVLGILVFLPLVLIAPGTGELIAWRGQPLGTLPTAAILALLLPLGLTFYAWKASHYFIFDKNRTVFANLVSDNKRALFHQLDSYNEGLLGGMGFFKGSQSVTAVEWQAYVKALNLYRHFPGILGIGYIENVAPENIDVFLDNARSEQAGFQIRPKTNGLPNYIITYIEPRSNNEQAVGLNIAFENHRFSAAVLSMESGQPAITRKISLVQDTKNDNGFLLLHPMYKGDTANDTPASRRANLMGWIYAPFKAQSFLHNLTESQGQDFRFQVFDGDHTDDESLIYDSHNSPSLATQPTPDYQVKRSFDVFQQRWTLRWTSTSRFESSIKSNEPLIILTFGLMFSGLFAYLLFQYAQRTQIVNAIVNQKTKELAERESLYRLLAENSSDMISRVALDGTRSYTSPACSTILGFTPEDMQSVNALDSFHPRHWTEVKVQNDRFAAGEIDYAEGIFDAKRKDGTWVKVEKAWKLVRDPATGQPQELVVTTRDVSQREQRSQQLKHAMAEAEIAKAKAEQASHAKSEFMASMSHEVRTPLNSIIGYTRLALGRGKLDPLVARDIKIVQEASRSLLGVVNDVLDYSGIEAGQFKLSLSPCALRSIVTDCHTLMQVAAEAKGIEAELIFPHELDNTVVLIDDQRLRQVLLNLQSNAIKFTEKGSIRIELSITKRDDHNLRVKFKVIDSGHGIAKSALPSLFNRFSQLDHGRDRKFGGTGLGLAICQKLVRAMDGEIIVESRLGVGSNFWFELPLSVANETDELVGLDRPGTEISNAPLNILVVDDLELNRELTEAVLVQAGHIVDAVASGIEAIEKVRTHHYDVVLMDVQMPGMDGLTATERIRSLGGLHIIMPIIAMTANVLPAEIELCRAAGMTDHIGKPFDWSVLLQKVNAVTLKNSSLKRCA